MIRQHFWILICDLAHAVVQRQPELKWLPLKDLHGLLYRPRVSIGAEIGRVSAIWWAPAIPSCLVAMPISTPIYSVATANINLYQSGLLDLMTLSELLAIVSPLLPLSTFPLTFILSFTSQRSYVLHNVQTEINRLNSKHLPVYRVREAEMTMVSDHLNFETREKINYTVSQKTVPTYILFLVCQI